MDNVIKALQTVGAAIPKDEQGQWDFDVWQAWQEILAALTRPDNAEGLWLWKNFINGRPEYWAFDNAYPCDENGDPMTLGEPCGYAIVKRSINGRPEVSDDAVMAAVVRARTKGGAE